MSYITRLRGVVITRILIYIKSNEHNMTVSIIERIYCDTPGTSSMRVYTEHIILFILDRYNMYTACPSVSV